MIDIKVIRDNPDLFKRAATHKHIACDVDRLLAVDARRREIQQQLDQLRHEQNEAGPQIALYRNPKSDWYKRAVAGGMTAEQIRAEADTLQARMAETKTQAKALEEENKQVIAEYDRLMLTVPQLPAEDVPIGDDEAANVEVRRVGEIPAFEFQAKDHCQLGAALGIIDVERGVKLAGTRNYLLRGDGVLLHQAVLRLAFDMMVDRGFEALTVPVLVRDAMMYGTGWYPEKMEEAYRCERDELSLVGTAEVPLTGLHADEILDEADLPKRYVANSVCFRREAGAAGRDTYGLFRIHYFDKVEQMILCRADAAASLEHHHEILANAEAVMQALELPYRVVNVCTAEMGQAKVQMFDIETWMPSRNAYCETHSASRFHDFQARRLNLRYRDASGKAKFCHTLNNTVIASPRILIPMLELNQNPDGTVDVPKALQPYMRGKEKITGGAQ